MSGIIQQILSLSRHSLLFAGVVIAWPFLRERPHYPGMADAEVAVPLEPVAQASPAGWTLHGAWRVRAADKRMVGLSGLACSRGALEIVSDIGAEIVMEFPDAGQRRVGAAVASVRGLFDGEARAIVGADTVTIDESGGKLWLDRADGTRKRIRLPRHRGSINQGVEAALEPGGNSRELILFLEGGREAYRLAEPETGHFEPIAVRGARMMITGAARHPDGRGFVLLRSLGPGGFSTALAQVAVHGKDAQVGPAMRLPLPRNANAEGLCIEPRGAGSARLWIVTDDNGLSWLAQRLIAWDVPFDWWPQAPEGARRD